MNFTQVLFKKQKAEIVPICLIMSIFQFESDFMRQQEANMEVSNEFLFNKHFYDCTFSIRRNKDERCLLTKASLLYTIFIIKIFAF